LWFLLALGYHYYLMKNPYKPALKYISTGVDVLMTTGILFLYHYDMGYSTSLKAPPFMNHFLTLALAAFRFDTALPIYGGVMAAVSYLVMFGGLLVIQGVEFGSPLDLFTTPKINLVYQAYRILYLIMLTLLTSGLARNVQRLVQSRVKEAEHAFIEKAEREKTQNLLERYFTPEIAAYLTDNPQDMGGTAQLVTVVLTDLRGFTAISERLGSAGSVSLLNEVFEQLVNIVFAHGGTLDKFYGDGMLVVFGVPRPRSDDALRAVLAAREMVEKTRRVRDDLHLELGTAIHTGEVIFGNIGSPKRMELTVIGDTVNTASRMESLNKEFQTNVILSETTCHEVSDYVKVRELPSRTLRGKSEVVRLFALEEVIALPPESNCKRPDIS
jgi:class 3 adenylate cyclase